MTIDHFNETLFQFLQSSPTPFHAVNNIEIFLRSKGFIHLKEQDRWQLKTAHSYFVSRENGAIIAFTKGSKENSEDGFRMLGAHTDSPCLQIKPKAGVKTDTYLQLGVEMYGGCLLHPWFDRDLSLAGRVCCEMANNSLKVLLINFQRPLLTLPSIAIHFNREANTNNTIDKQKHLAPVLSQAVDRQLPEFSDILFQKIAEEYPSETVRKILAFDIFCYDVQKPSYTGINKEIISSARLDNLISCHVGMTAIGKADKKLNTLLFCSNHEENGSTSATGAQGSFLDTVLERIMPDPETRKICLAQSFFISMDNAHATHPNFLEKQEPEHGIHLNKGPVIKINANQRYATNSLSSAVFKTICNKAQILPQEFVMRSDLPCGSTIGPITAARLGIKTVDVGAASLAMHSIREHTGSSDPFLLYQTIVQFLSDSLHRQLS
jgi:aspartyl aminopeptidase